ncbi:MAG: molybdate ABC transporter permease subunit [Verrucomicrobia bacterium]|nr:molybdate ABC transporter permease subunit [Verrucomicrobiota bacterium]MDE3097880.1 molybdate ABC transporter permease subunit [Verrucomicrobiota bacterium]
MNASDCWQIVRFTLGMAGFGDLLILLPGVALAWLLARRSWPGKALVETMVMLPLFIPPVATGLLLLLVFGRYGILGRCLPFQIVFTWRAVVLAAAVMGFPILVLAARVAFAEVNPRLEQIARTLGAGETRVFFTITLPLARRGILSGMVLAFARALGEFGATVVVAGMIPGRTMTLSLQIYQFIQLGHNGEAVVLLAVAAGITLCVLLLNQTTSRMRL